MNRVVFPLILSHNSDYNRGVYQIVGPAFLPPVRRRLCPLLTVCMAEIFPLREVLLVRNPQ